MATPVCYQVNYQTTFGGGEVYTRAVCTALASIGWRTVLFTHRDASFWDGMNLVDVHRVPISTVEEIDAGLPEHGATVLTHNLPDAPTGARWAARHRVAAFLHMPLWDRDPKGLGPLRLLLPVSEHVRASALARGLGNVHDEPMLAVADLVSRARGSATLSRGPLYDRVSRKFRDRLMARVGAALHRPRMFQRRAGLTLGIVSRITPIKQFAEMFSIVAPVIARQENVRLEIFGSGGYGAVREVRRALAPLGERVRFWGHQNDVAAVYSQLDYVLSGLPEKEALGLNLLEAQFSGTPVLAVRAPPFIETVVDRETGYLFRDPREDGGADFGALLNRIAAGAERPDPRRASAHLDQFTAPAFERRLARALGKLAA